MIAAGVNPITERRDGKKRKANRHTFGACADKLIESKKAGWRSKKHAAQWRATLETYARPRAGVTPDWAAVSGVPSPSVLSPADSQPSLARPAASNRA